MLHVKKNDDVMVISGADKGKQGKVIRVVTYEDGRAPRVVVEKLRMVKKHTKPNQQNRTGGIVEKEASIAISSVLPICPKEDKPRRFRFQSKDGKKIRVCVKCKEALS